jgi:type II secretory pathway component GspD/PulD (secretin)
VIEVFPVNNRLASEIQPLLIPLLETTDHIVANGDSLIVKTAPERLQTIANLIRKLDYPLNNFLISVIQGSNITAEQINSETGYEFNASSRQSEPVGQQYQDYPVQMEGRVYHQNSQIHSTHNDRNVQTIRTLEGSAAHIKVGKNLPINNYQVNTGGVYGSGVTQSTQWVEATTGFEVTPRLAGQQVVLGVSPWSDKLNNQGQIQTQELQTSIRANLGEWVELGSLDENGQSISNSSFAYSLQTGQNNLHVLVKVDVVN